MNRRGPRAAAIVLAIVVAPLVTACAGPWMPVATDADAARAQARWPDTSAAALNQGRTLIMRRCANCHQPPSPGEHTAGALAAFDQAVARDDPEVEVRERGNLPMGRDFQVDHHREPQSGGADLDRHRVDVDAVDGPRQHVSTDDAGIAVVAESSQRCRELLEDVNQKRT